MERTEQNQTPRHELKGIHALLYDLNALRERYRSKSAPTEHKQREIDKNYIRLKEAVARYIRMNP